MSTKKQTLKLLSNQKTHNYLPWVSATVKNSGILIICLTYLTILKSLKLDQITTKYFLSKVFDIAVTLTGFRRYLCRTVVLVCQKFWFCTTNLCIWGGKLKHKHFNKILLFKKQITSNSCYKDKDHMTDVTFIWSIPVLHAENSVPMLFFSSRLNPQKGYQTHHLQFWWMWNWYG